VVSGQWSVVSFGRPLGRLFLGIKIVICGTGQVFFGLRPALTRWLARQNRVPSGRLPGVFTQLIRGVSR
jgi:hypothetical protein